MLAVWRIRLQALHVKPLLARIVGIGRNPTQDEYDNQDYENSSRLYAQEIAIDSLRHSDWTVTVCSPTTHLPVVVLG